MPAGKLSGYASPLDNLQCSNSKYWFRKPGVRTSCSGCAGVCYVVLHHFARKRVQVQSVRHFKYNVK